MTVMMKMKIVTVTMRMKIVTVMTIVMNIIIIVSRVEELRLKKKISNDKVKTIILYKSQINTRKVSLSNLQYFEI